MNDLEGVAVEAAVMLVFVAGSVFLITLMNFSINGVLFGMKLLAVEVFTAFILSKVIKLLDKFFEGLLAKSKL